MIAAGLLLTFIASRDNSMKKSKSLSEIEKKMDQVKIIYRLRLVKMIGTRVENLSLFLYNICALAID